MSELQHIIKVNHIGFREKSQKRFVLTDNPQNAETFEIQYISHTEYKTVYKSNLTKVSDEEGHIFRTGDFSCVEKPGDYVIKVGNVLSRTFVIYDKAYDMCARTLLSYFTYQRCGSDLGWAGKCHLDDGYIAESGEHIDLSGGYHQSCDLRKSPAGCSIGVLSMLRYALKSTSSWGNILLKDEVRWACDYYVKTIQSNGVMYDTLNEPFGWEGRRFYKSGAPSSAQWCTTSILALGYEYLKEDFPREASEYLKKALLSFGYLTSDRRSEEVYRQPAPAPRGMDREFFYSLCYKGSVADMAYLTMCACDLYKVTNDKKYLPFIKKGSDFVFDSFFEGEYSYLLNSGKDSLNNMNNAGTYAIYPAGIISLCSAAEILDTDEIKKKLKSVANSVIETADENVWRILPAIYTEDDLNQPFGHTPNGQKQKTMRDILPNRIITGKLKSNGKETICYQDKTRKGIAPQSYTYYGIFLAKCSKILNDKKYLDYAQSYLDLLIGANEFDSSFINGVGYNIPNHVAFGQFFPSTPFIPGACGIGYKTPDVYTCRSEYDMPIVGMVMNLIGEMEDN